MEKNFKTIVLLLTTQAMINLGEIEDPVSKEKNLNIEGASLFINLLKVIKEKTKGNLTEEENAFLDGVLENLEKIFNREKNSDTVK